MNCFIQRMLGGILYALLLSPCHHAASGKVEGTEDMNNRGESVAWFETELDPVYQRWIHGPGELRGFWSAHPRGETKERAGANTFSSHISLHLVEDAKSPGGFRVDSPFSPSHSVAEMGFHTPKSMVEIRVLVSTATEGAAGTVELYRIGKGGERFLVGSREQVNARVDSWVVVSPEGHGQTFPAGEYVLVIKARKLVVDVWPGPSASPDTWTSLPEADADSRLQQTAFRATISFSDETKSNLRHDDEERPWLSLGKLDPSTEAEEAGMLFNVDLGEHNNPFFIYYPESFQKAYPNAFMRDLEGNPIQIESNPIRNMTNPVPAVDDPDLRRFSNQLVRQGAEALRASPWLKYYVIAGEECYPDYFGILPAGDFRKAFTDRFNLYSQLRGWGLSVNREEFRANPAGRFGRAWYLFREHALGDRAAEYMRTFLEKDSDHPVFYPTHGNPFFGPGQSGRKQMGYSPGLTAGACDGFETGQISIDTDVEWLNLLTVCHMTSWGVPVVSPRLGNKTLDPSAQGGGRSFTPAMLRRSVYEALGHGVWHIGLLQWTGVLGDGEWFIRDTPAEKEARQVFSEIQTAFPDLVGMSRVQPKVGLYLSDSTWRQEGWQARWTGFFQDALSHHWQIALVGDEMLGAELVSKIPVLISLDNLSVETSAIMGLKDFLAAGGQLIRWGEFARSDELGTPFENDPLRDVPRVVTLDNPPLETQRELLNACTTGSGAHKHVTQYQPAPFEDIREAILARNPETVLCPVQIETTGEVHAYTLTDGWNLAVVLLNRGTEPVAATLMPLMIADQNKRSWRWRRIDLVPETNAGSQAGTVALSLAGAGSAIVMLSPDYQSSGLEEQIQKCREVIDKWSQLGVDVASMRVSLEDACKAQQRGIDSKAYALSGRILRSLGIQADLVPDSTGVSRIRATVFGSSGDSVAGARVEFRLVPGNFHWSTLAETSPSVYETSIPREKMLVLFNPEKGCYEPYSGPVRLIVHAYKEKQEGSFLRTVVIGEGSH